MVQVGVLPLACELKAGIRQLLTSDLCTARSALPGVHAHELPLSRLSAALSAHSHLLPLPPHPVSDPGGHEVPALLLAPGRDGLTSLHLDAAPLQWWCTREGQARLCADGGSTGRLRHAYTQGRSRQPAGSRLPMRMHACLPARAAHRGALAAKRDLLGRKNVVQPAHHSLKEPGEEGGQQAGPGWRPSKARSRPQCRSLGSCSLGIGLQPDARGQRRAERAGARPRKHQNLQRRGEPRLAEGRGKGGCNQLSNRLFCPPQTRIHLPPAPAAHQTPPAQNQ